MTTSNNGKAMSQVTSVYFLSYVDAAGQVPSLYVTANPAKAKYFREVKRLRSGDVHWKGVILEKIVVRGTPRGVVAYIAQLVANILNALLELPDSTGYYVLQNRSVVEEYPKRISDDSLEDDDGWMP